MKTSTIIFQALSLTQFSLAGSYVLQDDYTPKNFVSMFNAYSGPDPTDGFVKYMDMNSGVSAGLVTSSAKSVVLSVDSKAITPGGRPSMRLESKKTYDSGLIIGDFAKMPVGCGTWPAFWTLGPNWPSSGEIDIIEGVNSQSVNAMTLHTAAGCSIGNTAGSFTGNIKTANCDVNAPGQGNNVGCGIQAAGASTYGAGFNSAGGGVYAVDWTADHIAVYFFPRGSVPADITTGTPNPSTWGEPQALFKGSCNIPAMFKKHSIVINTTFCGQWAGQASVWSSDPVCGAKAATCNDYVANNPSAFANANWEINSLRVYQATGGAAQSGVPVPSGAPVASGVPIPSSVPAGGSPSVAPDAPSVAPVSVPRPSRTRHTHGAASTFSNKRKQNKRDTPIDLNYVESLLQAAETAAPGGSSKPETQDDAAHVRLDLGSLRWRQFRG